MLGFGRGRDGGGGGDGEWEGEGRDGIMGTCLISPWQLNIVERIAAPAGSS